MQTIRPAVGDFRLIKDHLMWTIVAGNGHFEVDFQQYQFTAPMTIFLSPGMYFQLKAGSLEIEEAVFSRKQIAQYRDSRFLFQHVLSIAHLASAPGAVTADEQSLLLHSAESWRRMNPFRAAEEEISLIFDVKHLVDSSFIRRMSIRRLLAAGGLYQEAADPVLRERVGLSASKLLQRKLALEARKQVVFTDKSIKEISFDLGFQSTHYFNRFFRRITEQTPLEFRKDFQYQPGDSFLEDLLFLIEKHYREERSTRFYADQLNMSIKTLCKKVRERSSSTTGELIRDRLMLEARRLLLETPAVKDVAFNLGFEEANHFSSLFKAHSGQTPTQFQAANKKVHIS